ncbi:monocarboxylate transporter 10-like isoform X2 [Rhopilema esculentum]|uniref:monocarboxylate transporter 10-like isoform X2 n=1 Tax=Rhopilema esculentum TaxID=499914 RepID=UPI0031E17B27|eukprot:gene17205-8750_t
MGRPKTNSNDTVDSYWSWLSCFSNFFVGFICFGILSNFGVFHPRVMDHFDTDNQSSAWLGSLAFGMTFFMTPLSNALCEVTRASYVSLFGSLICIIGLVLSSFASDVSILYITYSFCFGIGSSFAFFPTVVALKTYFKRYLTLANGLATSGSGLGTFTLAPIIEHCLESYGIKWTYLFLAAIVLSLVISQKMLMCVEQRHKLPQDTEQQQLLIYKIKSIVFRGDLWTDKKYVVMVASMAVFHFGFFIPYVHLVFLATKKGIPTMKATMLISYLSISSTIGKVVFGFLINFFHLNVRMVTAFSMLCIGLGNCFVPLGEDYIAILSYAVLCGLSEGCIAGQIAVTVLETVGSNKMSQGLANLMAINAIFMMSGPPIAGFIFDKAQSYDTAFYLSGSTCTIGAILMLMLAFIDRKTNIDQKEYSVGEVSPSQSSLDENDNSDICRFKLSRFSLLKETSV